VNTGNKKQAGNMGESCDFSEIRKRVKKEIFEDGVGCVDFYAIKKPSATHIQSSWRGLILRRSCGHF
jgi:hypothetical protein